MRENQNNCIYKIFSLSDQLLWVLIYICFIILILMLLIDYGCYKLCNIRLLLFERNSRSYNYTGAFWREIKAYGGYRNMKGCILGDNFEEQGWLSRMFTILLILTWKLRYPQKRRADRKKGRGRFGSCSAWQGRQMTYLGEGRICLGDQRQGKLYWLTT